MNTLRRFFPVLSERRLDTHLAVMFGITTVLALAAIVFYVNREVTAILDDASSTLFSRMANESRSHVDKSVAGVDMLATLFASDPEAEHFDDAKDDAFLRRLKFVLDSTPVVSAIYIGYDDGGFVLLRRLTSSVARQTLAAPDRARYLLEVIRGDTTPQPASLMFLDAAMHRIGTANRPDLAFDPRTRGWYQQARGRQTSVLTEPYRFFVTDERGVTIAHALEAGHGVIGIDLGLADLSQELQRMKSTPSMQLLIVNASGALIAASDPDAEARLARELHASSVPGAIAASADSASSLALQGITSALLGASAAGVSDGTMSHITEGGRSWSIRTEPLQAGPWTFRMAIAAPDDALLASARRLTSTLSWFGIVLFVAVLVAIRVTARAVSRPLSAIAREAQAIQSFYFEDDHHGPRSPVVEIASLSEAIRKARTTIQRFIEIGRALSAERDPERLMDRLLKETIRITGAQSGVILLTEDEGATFAVMTRHEGAVATERMLSGSDELGKRVIEALQHKTVSHIELDGATNNGVLASLIGEGELGDGERHRVSVLPLTSRSGDTIGGMLLGMRARADDPGQDSHLVLAHALSGNAAIAIETMLLLKSRKSLLDSVIRMIAEAIDAKSPYTSGHCARVPVLTQALAHAACDTRSGPYADYALTPEDWEAVEVACWLHDCGKLTTAEYVIDKATKLEAISDRIHEIRMRFELLKAHAHTTYWQGVANGGDRAALEAVRDRTLTELDDDFAFVATCNEGGEFMAPDRVARLEQIAARRWTRTLDDRIGISSAEKARKNRVPVPVLPVDEPLLADRADHVIEHFSNHLSELEAGAGFTMRRPAHRLHLGELYNLSIGRGTLTAEERFEINRHITRTIVMLEQLPLSGALKQVPEFAGGHHEKMDGTGYPRGLRRAEMSPIARMMAIADVFEALTAGDRPYKKAKPLSEAIRIMGKMKEEHHLDPDLLDLFLSSGIWRDYAQRFLDPAQLDEPDIEAVLAIRVERDEGALEPH
ncbi:HD domain-containing phosphohydrolase [Pararobbsia silviterrae]|uniref:HAMP domain-containing protein n=1 Tax=Pararobbsia silviterrae TaxID=1792498 RepID=A0A494XS08_9BURK|nr:HD domain-containing phosphohydrolase [Pararobbsia silviterrae]RKP53418.1 HAMP domain-containing protein [Pararobbsia silviterrae]